MKFISTGIAFIKAHLIGAVFVAALALGLGVGFAFTGGSEAQGPEEAQLPLVLLVSLAELSNGSASVPLIGIVESTAEANLQTEASGVVTRVNYALGDFVSPGAVIASLENMSESAVVAQARAALQSAQASYAQTIASIGRSGETTREEAARAYRDAYVTASDAVENKTEPFFVNDRTAYPQLILPTGDDDLEDARAEISERLRVWERTIPEVNAPSDLAIYLNQAIEDLRFIETFLNELASEANRRITTGSSLDVTDTDRTALLTARTNVTGELSSLISIRDEWQGVVERSAGGTGEREAKLAAAEASLAQAEANLDAAYASLEKTIIRSPIGGFINALPIKVGQSVGMSEAAAVVINPDALEIVTYIAPSLRDRAEVGADVRLGENNTGVITHVAPGVSSRTGKIEVRIAPDGITGLTAGNSVSISLLNHVEPTSDASQSSGLVNLPITAIKFKSDESVIFTVSPESTLVEHVIEVGQVLGNRARISTDLPLSTLIVADARGFVAGDEVEVAE